VNHGRGKPKNARAGCLMCKPWKMNGAKGDKRPAHRRAEADEAEQRATADDPGLLAHDCWAASEPVEVDD
jgi:hypothetical protein